MKNLPTLHAVGDSIPQAWYRAIRLVWEKGLQMRTQYDRKDSSGNFIDPPSRDARVLIEVRNPFANPRYAPISHCERGTYLAEIMGAKNHLVLPMDTLKKVICGEELSSTAWPYSYHQRLTVHPETTGETLNQLAMAIEMVAKTPYTRRAMCTTAVPNLDPFLIEDIPCLRELQLRCTEEEDGSLNLCATTMWRSRDLYKAWGDNVIAVTFLLQWVTKELERLTEKTVRVGSYADFSCSLHIYGQDFGHVGGDEEKGLKSFFDTFPDSASFVVRSMNSETARDMEVIPQLTGLLSDHQRKQWKFTENEIHIIESIIESLRTSEMMA